MLNAIDLFVGCGGLSEGFEQSGKYKMLGAIEWESAPVKELRKHLKIKWNMVDAEERVLQFDIQRTKELFTGWEDEIYGTSKGLDNLIGDKKTRCNNRRSAMSSVLSCRKNSRSMTPHK